jgi:hypothetical protein
MRGECGQGSAPATNARQPPTGRILRAPKAYVVAAITRRRERLPRTGGRLDRPSRRQVCGSRRRDLEGVQALAYRDVAPAEPGFPGAGQQAFGDDLLRRHRFVAIPSAVSTRSWNLIFDPLKAAGFYSLDFQEPFALDTRLHPSA